MKFSELAKNVPWGTLAKGALLLIAGGAATGTAMKMNTPSVTPGIQKSECPKKNTGQCICPRPKFEIKPYSVNK